MLDKIKLNKIKNELINEFSEYVDKVFNIQKVEKISILTKDIKTNMLSLGAKLVGKWFEKNFGTGYKGTVMKYKTNDKEIILSFVDNMPKTYVCCLGEITLKRAYYHGEKTSLIPLEQEHDFLQSTFWPDVKEMVCLISCIDPYGIASDIIKRLSGIHISASSMEKITKEIGGELAKIEDAKISHIENIEEIKYDSKVEEVLVISADGTGIHTREGWKEVKNAAIYGIKKNNNGDIIADRKSYINRIENSHDFGNRIYIEALRRNVERSKKIITIGDGALWIWEEFSLHFPSSIQIVDWYHATEHLWKVTESLFNEKESEESKRWEDINEDLLYAGKINELVESIKLKTKEQNIKENSNRYYGLQTEMNYFIKNCDRMKYKYFEEQGYPIGSGVIEGACKNLVQLRMKRNGMRWSKEGAHAVLQLRCHYLSNRWNEVVDYAEKQKVA